MPYATKWEQQEKERDTEEPAHTGIPKDLTFSR
jgi:hypothetical protein